ncbi:putative nucleic acid-binding protein [Rhizobium sp. SG_E_25_P2]|uniref:PIN domain-containing protein n=1 Tax=Rhizobium sp. SG_E_25_P2 TaxID=2879942 RepID=UPI002474765D|nr:PIN domain-containing protein [Rhizobium sp. SG_E_25_P2]MDH6269137.1 putative nucleic acid-binding protein [Rhizobium sp. SG_E_25_P2]
MENCSDVFANRFTALVDACSLASVVRRNLLLSLAEAEFFRVRWSDEVLRETSAAIEKMARAKGKDHPDAHARRAIAAMSAAFDEARVADYEQFLQCGNDLPDPKDRHVLAAAIKAQASVIVTENLRDFPPDTLRRYGIEVRSADAFIADTIDLDIGRAISAVRTMRLRLKRPEKDADALLLDFEAAGLVKTVDILKGHVASL